MNKWIKRGLWTVAVVFFAVAGLIGLGAAVHSNVESYGISQGLAVAKVVKQSSDVLCGHDSGFILAGKVDVNQEEYNFYPICAGVFDASMGTWAKKMRK